MSKELLKSEFIRELLDDRVDEEAAPSPGPPGVAQDVESTGTEAADFDYDYDESLQASEPRAKDGRWSVLPDDPRELARLFVLAEVLGKPPPGLSGW